MGREHEGQESGLLGDGTAVEGHLAPALLEATRVTLGAALLQLVEAQRKTTATATATGY